MTQQEKITALGLMVDESNNSILSTYLDNAKQIVLNRLYPYGTNETDVPARYEYKQLEIAAYLINKRGAEGETSHNENGVNRTYESASVPKSMLEEITPYCGVI